MSPKALKSLSYFFITAVMAISGLYFYKTWAKGEPRWYFLILAFSIALLLSYNLLKKPRD